MRRRMTDAAQLDAISRQEGKPAMYKLKMLPEVLSLLNRNQYVNSLIDPEINLLEAVKFFLEPLDDGSLPAYNIQRDLMAALVRLPINKETLIASGIGKVIVFYTKSKRPEMLIKRMAERLLAEWTRPILQRSDDYSKRVYQEAAFDPKYVCCFPSSRGYANMEQADCKPGHRRYQPKRQRQRQGHENSFPLAWLTEHVRKPLMLATRWCLDRRRYRRASLRGPLEPVERIASVACGQDRLLRRRGEQEGRGRKRRHGKGEEDKGDLVLGCLVLDCFPFVFIFPVQR